MIIEQRSDLAGSLKGKKAIVEGFCDDVLREAMSALVWLGADVTFLGDGDASLPDGVARIACDLADPEAVGAACKGYLADNPVVDYALAYGQEVVPGYTSEMDLGALTRAFASGVASEIRFGEALVPALCEADASVLAFSSLPTTAATPASVNIIKSARGSVHSAFVKEVEPPKAEEGEEPLPAPVKVMNIPLSLSKTQRIESEIASLAEGEGLDAEAFRLREKITIVTCEESGCGIACALMIANDCKEKSLKDTEALKRCNIKASSAIGALELEAEAIDAQGLLDIVAFFEAQCADWEKRGLFERRRLTGDFKKVTGISHEQYLSNMRRLKAVIDDGKILTARDYQGRLNLLIRYLDHEAKSEKNAARRQQMQEWAQRTKDVVATLGREHVSSIIG